MRDCDCDTECHCDFYPVIERDADGIPARIRFAFGVPVAKPIPVAVLGTYTEPFTIRD